MIQTPRSKLSEKLKVAFKISVDLAVLDLIIDYNKQKMFKMQVLKGVLHPWTLFLKTLCIFSKNKATSDKVSYGSGQKCSKELKNHSFTSVETIVVKLQ